MLLNNYTHITTNSKKVKKDSIYVSINNNESYINDYPADIKAILNRKRRLKVF